ncbi:MAG: hypothetical protein RLN87_01635 [Parasphingopyxis sp.]|uniref:hypothetical protein n=1 Tax=Parasphingopyxis sp. TaxID=1920299 RepID=UPI0032EDFFC6
MFSRTSRTLKYALAGAALAAMSGTAMADVVVTASHGAAARDYPRGTRLRDNQSVTLGSGSVVTVLTDSGTRRWRGPGRFSASQGRQAGGSLNASSNVRAGITRGPDSPFPGVWDVVANEDGPFCYATGAAVGIWRPTNQTDQMVTITGPNGQSETVTIGTDFYSVAWPVTVAAVDGAEYRVQLQGEEPVTVHFVELDTDSEDRIDVAAALGSQECFSQLQTLADMIDESGEADASSD